MIAGTRDIIARLVEEGSWTARAKSLERLATRFAEGGLDDGEWQAFADAFRIAIYDSEPLVRRVLAESVKGASDLPRDVLLALARDIPAVAAPILEHSRLLTEDELLPIARAGSTAHRFAIAGRRLISGPLAEELCRPGERTVILRLLGNEGAAIGEDTLHHMLDHSADQPALGEAMGKRRLLPASVGLRLLAAAVPRRTAAERTPSPLPEAAVLDVPATAS